MKFSYNILFTINSNCINATEVVLMVEYKVLKFVKDEFPLQKSSL